MTDSNSVAIDALADDRRRAVLTVLALRESPVSLHRLATELVARADGASSDREREELLTSLHHVHLPTLDEAGYCTYDATEKVVSERDEMATTDGGSPAQSDIEGADQVETVFRAVSTRRRRLVVSVLDDAELPCSVDALAAVVAARQRDDATDASADDARERVVASLYHADLPILDDAGLIAYDRDAGRVTELTTPFPDPSALEDRPLAQLVTILPADSAGAVERFQSVVTP